MKIRIPFQIQQVSNYKQILWLIGDFILGVLIGYGLGLVRLHETITQGWQIIKLKEWWMQVSSFFTQTIWKPLASWFITFSPSIGFTSDVIAYQAAIIAIAIPVSLEIISRISERYQSGVITKEFNRQWQFKALLSLVIAEALLGITLKFFVDAKIDGYWKVLAWGIFLLFFATNFALLAFFNNLRQYTSNTKFLLDRLFDDLTHVLQRITAKRQISDKNLKEEQEKFINALEGIGDILLFETKNRKSSQYIIASLSKIQNMSQEFFALQQSQPERFSKLRYSAELLQLGKANQFETPARSLPLTNDYLPAFMAIVNQFVRLYETALEVQNLEIAREVIYNLNFLLKYLSLSTNYNSLNYNSLIENLLQVLAKLRYSNRNSQDDLAYILSVSWYIIVFEDTFNLEYLESFDLYFVPCIHEIISSGKTQLFDRLVKTLHDASHLKRYSNSSVERLQDYLQIAYQANQTDQLDQLDQKLHKLKSFVGRLQTQKQLHQCLDLFDQVEEIVHHHFNAINQEAVQKELEKIRDKFEFRFKFNHLIDLMFDLGAYCIFKQCYDYLDKMWKYRQPDDADANWLGHDITPASLPVLFNFYFQTSLAERGFPIVWDDHHGSSRYYGQYFLILLLREFLNPRVKTKQDRQNLIDEFQLPDDLDSYHIKNISHDVDLLIPLVNELFHSQLDSLEILGFDENLLYDATYYGIVPFLESLKPKADKQLEILVRSQRISRTKVEKFKTEFLEGYHKLVSVRELFKFLMLYEDRTNETGNDNLDRFGFGEVDEKTMFFEEWYVDYGHPGSIYGQNYARDEDSHLIVRMIKECNINESQSLENFLDTFEENLDNLIIIGANPQFYYLYNNPDKFMPKGVEGGLEIDLPGFIGSYVYTQHKIPVFEYYCQIPTDIGIPDESILILDKTHLAKFVQYAPATVEEPYQKENHFAFRIQSFAEDEALMTEFLQKPPDWLLQEGDEAQQRVFLESQVLIQIQEKFDLEIDPEFVGFMIPESNVSSKARKQQTI